MSRASLAYEERPMQREMAGRVLEALSEARHLVVEAGTGTGKTLAYLVPAVLSGRKIVVSTATRALQEQIVQRDLPFIREELGLDFQAAYLKGRSNYLCPRRMGSFDAQPLFPFQEDAALYERVRLWTRTTSTGDKADVADVPEDWSTWREITSSTESCIGQRCSHSDECFVCFARAEAAVADIVVVNHHLFFADLALRASEAGASCGAEVIPSYEAVIFDEAHAIEDVATTFFGFSLSNYRLRDLSRDAARAAAAGGAAVSKDLLELAARLDERAERFFLSLDLQEGRERIDSKTAAKADKHLTSLTDALELLAANAGRDEEDESLLALKRRSLELSSILRLVLDMSTPDLVHWSDVRGGGIFLHASPVETAPELREHLLSRVACVFTSATLSSGGDTRYFENRIGLSEGSEPLYERDVAILPSPFDFERQAALYVPKDLPWPNEPNFAAAVADEVASLCDLTEGRAFVLCTSFRNMVAVHESLSATLEWPVLKQGEAPKSALLKRFREQASVLVATQSFWEGVDVPGDDLSLVVVDKLPFAPPGDPLLAARMDILRDRGGSPFSDLQLPRAALALKQGFGRLIRTSRDRGIVAVCDARLAEKSYRGHFLRTLPPCPRFRHFEDLRRWWGTGNGGRSTARV